MSQTGTTILRGDTSIIPVLGATGIYGVGDLYVANNITLGGTVDGRDVAADGAAQDSHIANTSNPHSVTKAQVGLGNVENILNNFSGTGIPGVNDDSSAGYSVGSDWLNTTNNEMYTCVNNATGTAKWKYTTANEMYDAVIDPSGLGDYLKPSDAFNAGHTTVFVRTGTYTETVDIDIPDGGSMIGESIDDVIINFSGNVGILCDGIGTTEAGGTVNTTNASGIISGSGTTFTNATPGEYILLGNKYYEISSIESDTSLTLVDVYRGSSQTGLSTHIHSMFSNITLSNFCIMNAGVDNGIQFQGVIKGYIDRIIVDNFNNGINIQDSDFVQISGCVSKNNTLDGIIFNDCVNSYVDNCSLFNNGGDGLQCTDCNLVIIESCSVSHNERGVFITGTSTNIQVNDCTISYNNNRGVVTNTGTSKILVDRCIVVYNGNDGIDCDSSDNTISACIISNNNIGIDTGTSTLVVGCNIEDNLSHGVNVSSGDINTTINGCHIEGNGADGIRTISDRTIITNNRIYDNSSDGIQLRSGCAKCLVTNNIVSNNTANDIIDDAPSTSGNLVKYNILGTSNLTSIDSYTRTVVNAASYTLTNADQIIGVSYTTTGAVTLTLPAISTLGTHRYEIKDEGGNAFTNNITIACDVADTIDGAATGLINANYASVSLYNDGSNAWFVY
uniref:Right handed beta helix domain-containing protein n=1 Tax=viral metagenome TaxID=1070528 RepID=A0A6C0CLS9_9ZZZZ